MNFPTFGRSACWKAWYIPMMASTTCFCSSGPPGAVSPPQHPARRRPAAAIPRTRFVGCFMGDSVLDHRIEVPALELLQAVEERQLEKARRARHLPAHL